MEGRTISSPSVAKGPGAADGLDTTARQDAVRRIGRRRHFRIEFAMSTVGMVILAIIWGMSEYHNTGGWPTRGFSQSSGAHDVWNVWLVYPLMAWVLIIGTRAWVVYGHRSISESEIEREIDRHTRRR